MDKELFLAFVLYFTSKTFPPTFSLNDRRSLRRKAKQCQFIDGRLFCGGRRILLSDEIEDHLRSLHERESHPPANDLYLRARDIFIVPYLRLACADIVANCSFCADSRIAVRRSGPMVHCSKKKRKFLCRKIGIKWVKHFKTSNHEEIDASKFRPKLVNCPSPHNCVCTTLSVILTGSIKAAVAIQDWVRKIRKGRFAYMYDEYADELPTDGPGDTYFISRTDTRVIARELGVTIYEYFEQSREWIVYRGCHKGPTHGSIYLACRYLESRGEYHCMAVRGLKEK